MNLELFRRTADYARDVVSELTNDHLRLSTPCDGWDAGRVVLHLADVADALVNLIRTGQLRLPEPPRVDEPDPVATLQYSLDELLAEMSTTSETERREAAAQAGAIEFSMHGWDIGVASDPNHRTPDQLAEDVLALASSLISEDTRGTNFAARIDAPADASMSDHLAAFLGRRQVRVVPG